MLKAVIVVPVQAGWLAPGVRYDLLFVLSDLKTLHLEGEFKREHYDLRRRTPFWTL